MSAVNLLDRIITQGPTKKDESKFEIILSNKIYKDLCEELNRNVKTYKKYKIKTV